MKKQKRALITGITGQDGSYLAELLVGKGYKVYGLIRRSSNDPFVRLPELKHKVTFLYGNLRDIATIEAAVDESNPDEIYNLAAQSDVGVSFKCPHETIETNYYGVGRIVNAALAKNPKVRIYQASTSEMYGKAKPPQNETTVFMPVSPYGESKLRAHEDFIVASREKRGAFTVSGILFNHESPRRGEHFVTRKITISLAKIKLGLQDSFELGNLEAKRDWGYAADYVEAMWKMLQFDKPEDFVIATGESHTVRDFVEAAASALGMPIHWSGKGLKEVGKTADGKIVIRVNKKYYRPAEVHYLLGDSAKAKKKLGWNPKVKFGELVRMMTETDYERLKRGIVA